ncbi:hypothetical protein ACC778_02765 [Rhizobium ruizarguesonis]
MPDVEGVLGDDIVFTTSNVRGTDCLLGRLETNVELEGRPYTAILPAFIRDGRLDHLIELERGRWQRMKCEELEAFERFNIGRSNPPTAAEWKLGEII